MLVWYDHELWNDLNQYQKVQLTTMHCFKNVIIVLVRKHFGPRFFYCTNILWDSKGKLVNAFHAIGLFLHPLKVPENLLFCDYFMGCKKEASRINWLKRNKVPISSLEISCLFLCNSMIFFRQDDPIKDTTLCYHCNLPSDVCISMNDNLD